MEEESAALREQLDYYRARAPEYDEWWLRQNRYDRGAALNEQRFSQAREVEQALASFGPAGRILELAAGSGIWSERLLKYASELVLVDGSAEMLGLAASRLSSFKVRCHEADIFCWQPTERFDTVFFGFWLSHVPPEQFNQFWGLVRDCLAPGGRVFFIDSLHDATSTAANYQLPSSNATTLTRRLNDGSEFSIYKVFYKPKELADRLRALGWHFSLSCTEHYFLFGSGTRIRDRAVL